MSESVAVITPTLSSRKRLLEDAKASVAAQTVAADHRILEDTAQLGPATCRNILARHTEAEWLLPLDDDDVLYPDAVQVLLSQAGDADIVYPWTRMVGRTDSWVPNKLWNRDALHRLNFIPVTALIKRDTWQMLGGQRQVPLEDWDFYRRAELHGCKFRCVPEVLWEYRFHDSNNFQREAR